MKKIIYLILAAALVLSLSACDDVLVDLDTPKSSELSAEYDFYSDSMNTIRSRMGITPEQADEVFIALAEKGLDAKITNISKSDDSFKVWYGSKYMFVSMNDDGTVAEITGGNGSESSLSDESAENILLSQAVNVKDVLSGSGDVIGQYAYIRVLKSQFKKVSESDFIEFVETVVKSDEYKGLNYFLIKCEDDTGVLISGADEHIIQYGEVGPDDMLSETLLFFSLGEDGHYTETAPSTD